MNNVYTYKMSLRYCIMAKNMKHRYYCMHNIQKKIVLSDKICKFDDIS